MIIFTPYIQLNTIKVNKPSQDGDLQIINPLKTSDTLKQEVLNSNQNLPSVNSDTASDCSRNSVADVTFFDRNNFILNTGSQPNKQFPFIFTEKVRQREAQQRSALINHLKPGINMPAQPLHTDWMIVVLFVSAFLFSLVKRSTGKFSDNLSRFFLFRGINENNSRELGGLFYWQSTVLNFVSFLIIGLFGYTAAEYYNLIPAGINGFFIWLIAFGIISIAVALRHLTCLITGTGSGEEDAFREYLLGIYQSYRFAALFLAVIVILVSFTSFIHVNDLIISGLVISCVVYILRVVRLMIIFLNRNISIFYLILYLCALEILPVLIIAKYFTGLV